MRQQNTRPDFTRRPTFGPGVRFPPNRRPMPFERDDAALPTFNGRPEFGSGAHFTPRTITFGPRRDDPTPN
ncbi:hypothetical protein [Micrococcus luteus]|uniref:hypothetical protein n=1 Tax=Micrococcus luteus TaxID=1270 RepID=UPI0034DABAD9